MQSKVETKTSPRACAPINDKLKHVAQLFANCHSRKVSFPITSHTGHALNLHQHRSSAASHTGIHSVSGSPSCHQLAGCKRLPLGAANKSSPWMKLVSDKSKVSSRNHYRSDPVRVQSTSLTRFAVKCYSAKATTLSLQIATHRLQLQLQFGAKVCPGPMHESPPARPPRLTPRRLGSKDSP